MTPEKLTKMLVAMGWRVKEQPEMKRVVAQIGHDRGSLVVVGFPTSGEGRVWEHALETTAHAMAKHYGIPIHRPLGDLFHDIELRGMGATAEAVAYCNELVDATALIESLIRERDEARAELFARRGMIRRLADALETEDNLWTDSDSPHPCHADLIAEARALLDGSR